MRIAVCFWGLTRSLKYTIRSVHEQLDHLRTFGDVVTFMHTYKILRPYTNDWAFERNVFLDPDEYKLLGPDHFIWDDQDEVAKGIDFKAYRTHKDNYNTNYQTIDNLILAMYSLHRVTDLMLRHNSKKEFDYIVFMRPDVLFDTKPAWKYFEKATENTIVAPYFGSYFEERHKINDRYAICKPNVAKIYGRRLKFLLPYSKTRDIISEIFLYDVMVEHDIDIILRWICFNRVRTDGRILPDCKTSYT